MATLAGGTQGKKKRNGRKGYTRRSEFVVPRSCTNGSSKRKKGEKRGEGGEDRDSLSPEKKNRGISASRAEECFFPYLLGGGGREGPTFCLDAKRKKNPFRGPCTSWWKGGKKESRWS